MDISLIVFLLRCCPNLAKNIPDTESSINNSDNLIERNSCLMFVETIEEREIIEIVKKCKNIHWLWWNRYKNSKMGNRGDF